MNNLHMNTRLIYTKEDNPSYILDNTTQDFTGNTIIRI